MSDPVGELQEDLGRAMAEYAATGESQEIERIANFVAGRIAPSYIRRESIEVAGWITASGEFNDKKTNDDDRPVFRIPPRLIVGACDVQQLA